MKLPRKKSLLSALLAVAALIVIFSSGAALWFVIAAPYSVTGAMGHNYSSHQVGALEVIYGRRGINGEPGLHNQLYLMIICPDVEEASSKAAYSGINHDVMSNPRFDYSWETQNGTVSVSFRWNMWSDTISIGKQKFSRKDGNVFVVVKKSTGELTTQQCGMLGPMAELPEIVQHIRKQLPKDELVASVKFYDVK